jgi:hypothetical protein
MFRSDHVYDFGLIQSKIIVIWPASAANPNPVKRPPKRRLEGIGPSPYNPALAEARPACMAG